MDVDILIIGAGQAGLGVGYWLSRKGSATFAILDGGSELGQSWTSRWDSLSLFTPRRFSSLPGLRFPAGLDPFATKDEVADYLKRYAARFDLPVELNRRVDAVEVVEGRLKARTDAGAVCAGHVVVATGPFHSPYVPDGARRLSAAVRQLHSSDYRTPVDFDNPDVVVVGGGNSAAQLACELADTHRVTVVSPRPLWFLPKDVLGVDLYQWLSITGVLNASATARVSRYVRARGDAIIGKDLEIRIKAGQVRYLRGRVVDADGGEIILDDGSRIAAPAVLWCTGFRPDYRWLRVPGALDDAGEPIHEGGASPVAGLHWMGLPWQTRLNSSLINGVDRDAHDTVARITG